MKSWLGWNQALVHWENEAPNCSSAGFLLQRGRQQPHAKTSSIISSFSLVYMRRMVSAFLIWRHTGMGHDKIVNI